MSTMRAESGRITTRDVVTTRARPVPMHDGTTDAPLPPSRTQQYFSSNPNWHLYARLVQAIRRLRDRGQGFYEDRPIFFRDDHVVVKIGTGSLVVKDAKSGGFHGAYLDHCYSIEQQILTERVVFEKFLGKTVEEAVPNILVHLVNGTLSVASPAQAGGGRGASKPFKKL
jgi:hypothetical protein